MTCAVPPGAGVSLRALFTNCRGNSAGPSKPLALVEAATAIESGCEALLPAESATCAVKEKVPSADVVPESVPELGSSDKPAGSVPDTTLHAYGVVPPAAASVAAYGLPTLVPGRLDVPIVSELVVVESAETATVALACAFGSATLVAVTVTDFVPDTLGAVNIPDVEIQPAVVDHFTAVLLVFRVEAENCSLPVDFTLVDNGVISIWTFAVSGELPTGSVKVRDPFARRSRSVTAMSKWNAPDALGLPEMLPVKGFRLRPGGSVPEHSQK